MRLINGRWNEPSRSMGMALLLATASGVAAFAPTSATAQSSAATRSFSIPAQSLPDALILFGRQAGIEVTAESVNTRGQSTQGVSGQLAPADALSQLLAGTGLTFRWQSDRSVVVEPAPQAAEGAIQLGPVRVEGNAGSGAVVFASPIRTSDLGTTEGTGSYRSPVTTTALRMPLTLRETPQSVTVITRQRIEDQNITEISQALAQTIGINFNLGGSPDSDQSGLYSRGFEVNNWQVDGIARPTAYGFGDAYADMAIYDRVEVIRGASGLLNGSGNPSATVNLVRKRAPGEWQMQLEAQGGSWDYVRGQVDVGGPVDKDGRVRGRFVAAYQDGGLNIDRATSHRSIFYGTVEADLTETTLLRAGIDYLNRSADDANMAGVPIVTTDGTPTHFSRSRNTVTDWTRYDRDSLSAFASIEQKLGEWSLRADLDWTRKTYDMVFGYALRGALNPDGTGTGIWPGRWADKQRMTSLVGTASGPLRIFSDDDLLMVGASHYTTKEGGDDYQIWFFDGYDPSIPNYYDWQGDGLPEPGWPYLGQYGNDEKQTAAFATLRIKPLPMLSVIAGGRLTDWRREYWNQTTGEGRTVSPTSVKGEFTPYVGVILDVTRNVSLYASYTSIFSPQSYRDINGDYLDPLTGKNYEIGAKADLMNGRLALSGAWFSIRQSNFPVYVPDVVGPTGDSVYESVDGTRSEGFELEATGEPLPGWKIAGGFSHVTVKDREGVPLNTQVPRDSFRLLTSYDLTGAGMRGLTVGGNVLWNSRTYSDISYVADGLTIAEQKPYAVVDAFARYALTPNLTLSVNASNLLDKRYYSSVAYFATFGEARRIVGTLRAKF
ncbi:outer membrane receptor for ferric coprogen and ferric-rhodotorulic acid [Sphingobium xenophagum]|uniref:Outer membrane receptor for ferric coprogen and ferric-rhodotorulic acid n=1 Tax=Sphingobium xenophagum TaxID=121428 RepID=A0ABU1X0T7_SPHXE|nr:TonB-dependent siderophore receptor [Sphingobium xenophagum]MDR7154792.1 outer membrane receptor for ferric coprogen and ferric-rhodotorulic acid [Sphingobium xenophagum]